jgi:hypothetical protein
VVQYVTSPVPITDEISQLERYLREELARVENSTDDIYGLASIVTALYQVAGYGGIGLDAITPLSDINTTRQVLPFDVELIAEPRFVGYDLANNAMSVEEVGIWRMNAKVALEFTELNAGRRLAMQLYDLTAAADVGPVFNFAVGRNMDGINLNFNLLVEIPDVVVGNQLQLRVFSVADTFSSVSAIGSIWDMNHVSEFKGDLFERSTAAMVEDL